MYLDSWTEHSRFLCSAVLYSVGLHFHHQSHPRLGTVSLWFSLFVPGAISPLFSSNILGPSLPGARIFQCHLFFCLFILFCLRPLSVSRRYEVSKYDFALLRLVGPSPLPLDVGWDPASSCRRLLRGQLQLRSSRRRGRAHVLPLRHLVSQQSYFQLSILKKNAKG